MTPRRLTVSSRRREAGFTTIEVLVGSVVSLLVLLGLLGFFDAQTRAYTTLSTYSQSQNVTRAAIDLITRDLRMSSFDPTDLAITDSPGPTCPGVKEGIALASSTSLWIRQDLDGDGVLTSPGDSVMYFQGTDQLQRWDIGTGAAPLPLVTGVPANGLSFRYFDGQSPPVELVPAGSPALLTRAQRACVEKVRVQIDSVIADPRPDRPDLHATVESDAAIRNRSLMKF